MANDQHPAERVNGKDGKPNPMLACPNCTATPGRVFDRDGGGGFYIDCPVCHGTAEVPDTAELAKAHAAKKTAPAAGS